MAGFDGMALSAERGGDALNSAGQGDDLELNNVGMVLRADRLRRGQELTEVSKILRIQLSYLNAIEQGKYENLPHGPYALGFVRTYADYLDLDADEIVRRFKQEFQRATERSRLVFPTPEQETSIPSATVVVVSVALALAAYGVWYYTQTQDQSVAQLVEPVPERLVELANDQNRAAPQPAVEARPLQDAAVAVAPERKIEDQGVLQGQAEQAVDIGTETLASATPPSIDVTDDEGEAAAAAAPVETGAAVVYRVAAAQPEPLAVAETVDPGLRDEGAIKLREEAAIDEAAVDDAAVDDDAVENVAAELAAIPAVPDLNREAPAISVGADTADDTALAVAASEPGAASRIVIRATDRSWVRVLGADDKVLLTRMLMPGDVYKAPNEPQLSLEAGNAGALEIEVDGTNCRRSAALARWFPIIRSSWMRYWLKSNSAKLKN